MVGWDATYILRYITAGFVGVALLSVVFAEHPNNNPDYEVFNNEIINSKSLKISLASSIAITIPMTIDMIFDYIYYPNLDPLLFERAVFAFSLLIISAIPLCYKISSDMVIPRIAQIFIVTIFCQNIMMFFCSVAVAHRYHSKIWTARRSILLVSVFSCGMTMLCYFENSSDCRAKQIVHDFVDIINYIIFVVYIALTCFTLKNIYQRAKKTQEETGFFNIESNDLISMLFLSCVIFFGFVAIIYTSTESGHHVTERLGKDLTFFAYCRIILTVILVVLPSRMVRFEVVNVKHALETKKCIARHVYHEMRTPLNIVVIGLELLSNALFSNPSSTEINEESGEVTQHNQNIGEEDAELVEIMDNVMLSCATTVEILNDMLVFEKLEMGSYTLNLNYYNVIQFVKQTLKSFLMQAKAKNIKIKLIDQLDSSKDMKSNGPSASGVRSKSINSSGDCHCIKIDAVKMSQVLRNFVSNALKITPIGGSITVVIKELRQEVSDSVHELSLGHRIRVACGYILNMLRPTEGGHYLKQDAPVSPEAESLAVSSGTTTKLAAYENGASVESLIPGDENNASFLKTKEIPSLNFEQDELRHMVRISVTDTGEGISSTDIRQVFTDAQPNPELHDDSGNGFGLKVAKSVVELHGGKVGVTSGGLGKGSTFHTDLPLYILQNDISTVSINQNGLISSASSNGNSEGRKDKATINNDTTLENVNSFSLSPLETDPNARGSGKEASSSTFFARFIANVAYLLGLQDDVCGATDTDNDILNSDSDMNLKKINSYLHGDDNNALANSIQMNTLSNSGKMLMYNKSESSGNKSVVSEKRRSSVGVHVNFNKIRRILLVDDSALCRRMVRKVLESVNSKLHVDDVSDGQTCLKVISKYHGKYMAEKKQFPSVNFARENCYDVIILDHVMPGMSGLQTAVELRREYVEGANALNTYFDGLIIGLSGLTDSSDIDEFVQAGVDVVLTKPLDTRKLIDILRQYDQSV